MWIYRNLIIASPQRDLAADICATLAGAGGSGMFTTPLSADGAAPATHYISSGLIEDNFAALLPLDAMVDDVWTRTYAGLPETIVQLYNATDNPPVTLDQVTAVFATADVSEEDPHQAMERLGLQMVQEPTEFLKD